MPDIDAARSEALERAVKLHAGRDGAHDPFDSRPPHERVLHTAGEFLREWLLARPARIAVGNPVISEQASPARTFPSTRGADMAVTMKDSQIATYPAPEALDSKGFEVTDAITVSEDSAGAVVALTSNPDGTSVFTAVAPGAAQVTWTDGSISFSDTLNVVAGDAASIVVGAPTITDQAPAPSA